MEAMEAHCKEEMTGRKAMGRKSKLKVAEVAKVSDSTK